MSLQGAFGRTFLGGIFGFSCGSPASCLEESVGPLAASKKGLFVKLDFQHDSGCDSMSGGVSPSSQPGFHNLVLLHASINAVQQHHTK